MENNKQKIYILLSIIILLIFTFFVYLTAFIQPKIHFNAGINPISDEDYKRIIKNEQVTSSDKGIEEFNHINIKIKVITPLGLIKHVTIDRDKLLVYLKDNDKIQILGGGNFEHGNGKEYKDNIEIYLKETTNDELRNILGDFKYKVSWKNIWNSTNDKIFYLKDYLK